ncbi:MAG: hypothetical protein LKK08_05755 [Bacteroidales bacterium]|jgi:hypothetical protein|nr:hypothetical protein [Bacteroidales bacterium]MCI2145734.1 hypothetical protein [Bacteroidales bacterium]
MGKRIILLLAVSACLLSSCSRIHTIRFDGSKEMSGGKIALKDINPRLPKDWDGYDFVAIEFKISTSQRFEVGFTTDDGYNELRIMSYVPKAWNRLVIPLKYYTELPDPASELASTYNHPRYTGWINLGGSRGPLHGVDSVGFRIRRAIGSPYIEIRDIELYKEDPGDAYLEKHPAIDSFGQNTFMNYPEKVSSISELREYWAAEDAEPVSKEKYDYSEYGGYLQHKTAATGYFRTEKIDGKWWFVDPDGYLFLSVGVDCVSPGNGGRVRDYEKRSNMFESMPPKDIFPSEHEGSRGNDYSLGAWNLYRRYGRGYAEKADEMIIKRMDKWGLNTIANWSSMDVIDMGKKAFVLSLDDIRMDPGLMGLADVYDPSFDSMAEKSIITTITPNLHNRYLIGYFIGNEPAWINQETRLCSIILDGPDRPVKKALQEWLSANGDNDATRRKFVLHSFDIFLDKVNHLLKKADPNHLNLGMRLGDPDTLGDDLLAVCAKHFDVFSFNCYMLKPKYEMLDHAYAVMGLPMMIGEYHFGTVDRGMAQSLWQVESQEQRGVAYRYYTEQGYSHPALIGTGYFQWGDQDITGRYDGENYNCGLVDVTDRPYKALVDAVSETSAVLYEVHSGIRKPFSEEPVNARGHEQVPDLW